MTPKIPTRKVLAALTMAVAGLGASSSALALDAAAAEAMVRQNGCFKCHSIEKKKDGPPYKEVAAKYKGKANAEQRLITHITTGEKAKFPDGHEEDHKIIKTKDMNEVRNVIQWILAQ
ncbi:MAG: c-type cytochrome [Burkholderiaceae bacterium]|nr:c-type cytochrome [Burkholderiaceae bacterium]